MALNKELPSDIRESDELYGAAETIRAMAMSQISGLGPPSNLHGSMGALQGQDHRLQSAGCKERSIPLQQGGKDDGTALNRERPIYSQTASHEMVCDVLEGFDDPVPEDRLVEKGDAHDKREYPKRNGLSEKIGPGNASPVGPSGHPERYFGDKVNGISYENEIYENTVSHAIPVDRQNQLWRVADALRAAREEAFCSDMPVMANRSQMHGDQTQVSSKIGSLSSNVNAPSTEANSKKKSRAIKKPLAKRDNKWIPRVGAPWLSNISGYARHVNVTKKKKVNSIIEEAEAREILEILQYIHFVQSSMVSESMQHSNRFEFRQKQDFFDVELSKIGYQEVLDLNIRIRNVEFDEESIRVATYGILKFTKTTGSCVMAVALLLLAYDSHSLDIAKLPYLYIFDSCLRLEYSAKYGDHYAQHLYGSTDLYLTKILEPLIPHLLSGIRGIETCIVDAQEILKVWIMRSYFSEEMTQYVKDFSLNGFGLMARDPRLNRKRKMGSG